MTAIVSDNKINIINPVSQETITVLDCTPENQVNIIIQAACDFKDWRNLDLSIGTQPSTPTVIAPAKFPPKDANFNDFDK